MKHPKNRIKKNECVKKSLILKKWINSKKDINFNKRKKKLIKNSKKEKSKKKNKSEKRLKKNKNNYKENSQKNTKQKSEKINENFEKTKDKKHKKNLKKFLSKKTKYKKRFSNSEIKKKKNSIKRSKFFEIYKSTKNLQETTEITDLKEKIKLEILKEKKIPKTDLSYYTIIKQIGKGAFGKVYLSLQKLTNRLVAIKIIKKKPDSFFISEKIINEIKIMKKLNSNKNIIKLLEVFETKKKVFLVMEYSNKGNLLNFIKKKKNLSLKKIKKIFYQISKALFFIHKNQIIHRDIKLDNILIDQFGDPKICDFGISKILLINELINEKCGTPAYLAPEIIEEKENRGYKADIWSLGILLFFMINRKMPFEASNFENLKIEMEKKKFFFGNLDFEVRNFLEKILVFEPEQRLCVEQVLKDPFFEELDIFGESVEQDFFFEKDLNLFVLDCLVDYGYDRESVIDSLNFGKLNHITACYYNLIKDYIT